jgi:hypothetical protein
VQNVPEMALRGNEVSPGRGNKLLDHVTAGMTELIRSAEDGMWAD